MNPVLNAAFAAVVATSLSSSADASVLGGEDFSKSARHARCISAVSISGLSGEEDKGSVDLSAQQVLSYHFMQGVMVLGPGFGALAKSYVQSYAQEINGKILRNTFGKDDLKAMKADVLRCVGEVPNIKPSALVSYDRYKPD